MKAYKLFSVKKDGSIGPLFINRKQRLDAGVWYEAEDHPTKGFAHRMGWHCTTQPIAPHLKTDTPDRKWYEVEIEDYKKFNRPQSQGGTWLLANKLRVIGPAA